MTHTGWIRSALAIGVVACSGEPSDPGGDDGLQVTSVAPADGATDVPWTAAFEATLSAGLDPATVGAAAVGLTLEGTPVPAVVTYDAPSRTIRLAAPLLPGATYRAELKPALRSLEGDSLAEARVWTATTRAWDPAPLSGIGELDFFALALGPSGSVHLFGDGDYRPTSDYFTPYRKYVSCASNCAVPASWGRMAVDSAWEPWGTSTLEVDQTGRVHLMHVARTFPGLDGVRYGTCASDCLTPGNWAIATVDTSRQLVGFARAESGLHLVTGPAGGTPALRYATCETDCTEPANWAGTPIPVSGYVWDAARALRVDRTGRLHLVTVYAEVQSYATCPSDCLSPGQWAATPAEWAGAHATSPSHTVDAAGRVHLVFTDASRAFTYARCEADCATPSSWETVRLDEGDHYGSALTVDEAGRITALNPVALSGEVRFLTCLTDCLEAGNWQVASVDRANIFQLPSAGPPRLALDPQGRLRMVYNDAARALSYLE